MSQFSDDELPEELEAVARRMLAERPEVTPLELDSLRGMVRARMRRAPRSRREQLMKSRMAITAMLVVGFVMSTAGTGLAVSGLTDTGSAAEGQYGPVVTTPTTTPTTTVTPTQLGGPQGNVQGQAVESSPAPAEEKESTPAPEKKPTVKKTQPVAVAPVVQAPRQVVAAQSGTELPFTGFSAIPVLLVGLALLAGGLVLRKRTREHGA